MTLFRILLTIAVVIPIAATFLLAQTTPAFKFVDKGVMVQDSRLAEQVTLLSVQRGKDSRATLHELTTNQALKPFYHGVASGDPLADRVIIWTRITPERDTTLLVGWRIATDTALKNVVRTGSATTNADRDYTVKVDVTGLEADKTYYYCFTALGKNSLVGRTKTLPNAISSVPQVRLAIVSCSSFPHGFFNAYGRIAERNDLDAVLHLGDYIYEYNASETSFGGETGKRIGRVSMPQNEIISLADYRTRYSQYRLDPDLMRLHQQQPIIHIWDDHESANDSYVDGAENHTPSTEGSWSVRKAIGKRVAYEWLPTRENRDTIIYRRFQFGSLVDVFMLDTRLEGRDGQVSPVGPDSTKARRDAAIADPKRKIMSQTQYDWLTSGLRASTSTWRLLGNQVMFTPMAVDSLTAGFIGRYSLWLTPFASRLSETLVEAFEGDVWTNYPAQRKNLVDFLQQNNIKNVVISTGDFHTAFAMDVTLNGRNASLYNRRTGAGTAAVEFMCPSITSANFDENFYSGFRNFFYSQLRSFMPSSVAFLNAVGIAVTATPTAGTILQNLLNERNPQLKFQNLNDHGYTILDFTRERTQGDYWFVDTILIPSKRERFGGGMVTKAGESNLQPVAQPAPNKAFQAIPAPFLPPPSALAKSLAPNIGGETSGITLLGAFPNPTQSTSYLNYVVNAAMPVTVRILDSDGREKATLVNAQIQEGAITLVVDIGRLNLPSAQYRYVISTPSGACVRDFTLLR